MEEKEKLKIIFQKMKIDCRKNDMEAYLCLSAPLAGEEYTLALVLSFLIAKGINYGVDEEVIVHMLNRQIYNKHVLIAKGLEKTDGKDGYYEYYFDHNISNKPRELMDGSIDYRTIQFVQVKEGDELVRYYGAIDGVMGYTVKGKPLIPYRGKDKRPLKGKGFIVSEDKTLYTAAFTGKVECKDERLVVTNTFDVKGDIDFLTGDISFDGDVLIRGNVEVGMSVVATGNVTVEGHVEGAYINAGKDVILQNGAQGAGRGKIEAKGNVSGKFFEQMVIQAGGDVNANSILNCDVKCEGMVIVSGKLGILVGGFTSAVKQVSATIIGNMSEVKTEIEVGLPDSKFYEVTAIEKEIEKSSALLTKVNELADALLKVQTNMDPAVLQYKKQEVMRTRIKLNMEIGVMVQKRTDLILQLEYVTESKVVALKRVYPGVRVKVNGVQTLIRETIEDVAIKRRGEDVCIFANG